MSSSAHPTSPGQWSGFFGLLVIKTRRYFLGYKVLKLLMKLSFAYLNCKGIIKNSWPPNNTTADVMSLELPVRHEKRKPNARKHTHAILRKNNPFVTIWWDRSQRRGVSSESRSSPPSCTSPLAREGQPFVWLSRCSFHSFLQYFFFFFEHFKIKILPSAFKIFPFVI